MIALLGEKAGMTRVFDEEGRVIPVTVIYSRPNYIVDVRTQERDGYNAVVLGYGDVRINKLTLPVVGKFYRGELNRIKKSLSDKETLALYREALGKEFSDRERFIREKGLDKVLYFAVEYFKIDENTDLDELFPSDADPAEIMKPFFRFLIEKENEESLRAKESGISKEYVHITLPARHIREFRTDDISSYQPGDYLTVQAFEGIEKVDVIGRSKGRGFAGVIKRWNFAGGPGAHGTKFIRRPGSIGASTYPGRVIKGKKMAGHYGNERVTVINLRLVSIDSENNLLLVKGGIPGPNGSVVLVRKAKRSA